MPLEDRTARLTILIDPRKKEVFERLCAEEDATPSQVVRRLIRGYIEQRTGQTWDPARQHRSYYCSGPGKETIPREKNLEVVEAHCSVRKVSLD